MKEKQVVSKPESRLRAHPVKVECCVLCLINFSSKRINKPRT